MEKGYGTIARESEGTCAYRRSAPAFLTPHRPRAFVVSHFRFANEKTKRSADALVETQPPLGANQLVQYIIFHSFSIVVERLERRTATLFDKNIRIQQKKSRWRLTTLSPHHLFVAAVEHFDRETQNHEFYTPRLGSAASLRYSSDNTSSRTYSMLLLSKYNNQNGIPWTHHLTPLCQERRTTTRGTTVRHATTSSRGYSNPRQFVWRNWSRGRCDYGILLCYGDTALEPHVPTG